MLKRLVNGFRSFQRAVSLAPEVWTAMLIRMFLKPEVLRFLLDVILALASHFHDKIPETFWLCISRLLHWLEKPDGLQDS